MFQKFNYQQRDLEYLKKPPTNSKVRDSTKSAIKDFLKNTSTLNSTINSSILNKNILSKTSNLDSFKEFRNNNKDEYRDLNSSKDRDFISTNLDDSQGDRMMQSNNSRKRLSGLSDNIVKKVNKFSLFNNKENNDNNE